MIDFMAGEGHFLDHLAPIWAALPEWARGRFWVLPRAADRAAQVLEGQETVYDAELIPGVAPTVVASIGDYRRALGRPRILAEHGAGQTYSSRHPSYAGGLGRDDAALFIVPNHHARRRNEARYPRIPNAVVGCPKLDRMPPAPTGPLTAAVSFHWRCKVNPETGTALDHYAAHLATARQDLARAGVRLVAHAHPRILEEARPIFAAAGLEVLDTFEEVLAHAHLYAVDNSSTLFEFAAAGRPVVVLNQPDYRRGVEHGLRFWAAADVGAQVDHPQDLAATILRALEDPPELVRSRERALAHVYPVRDGTSSLRAASAVLSVIAPGRCMVCGAGSCACGGTTTIVPVDQPMRSRSMTRGPKQLYKNPNGYGYVRLSDAKAVALGLIPATEGPVAPLPARTPAVPQGAIPAGGPTARARAKAAAEAAKAATVEAQAAQTESGNLAPAPEAEAATDGEGDAGQKAPPAPEPVEDPKEKKRPKPGPSSSRRRRPASTKAG